MKIRGDFVTNSSSVSYILTMKKEIADVLLSYFGESGSTQLLKFIKEQIERNDQKTQLGGEEIYSMRIKFDTDVLTPFDEYTKGETLYQTDFSNLSDEEMWTVIYSMIMEGKLDVLHGSIGATMVETY